MALTEDQLRSKILSDAQSTLQRGQAASASLSNPSYFATSIPTASPFPISSLSSLQPKQPSSIPMYGGGDVNFGLGGASINYPYSYGTITKTPQQFSSNLPQAPVAPSSLFSTSPVAESLRPTNGGMLNPMYSNPFLSPSERMGTNLTSLPTNQPTSMAIGGGPMSLTKGQAMTSPQTAEAQGRQMMQTPYGAIYATEQQASNAMTPRTLNQQGSRTPEQQQALLAQARQTGQKMASDYANTMATFAQDRRENTPTYTTFTGSSIKAPTNMFGQPIASWANIYEKSSAANEAALAKIRGDRGAERNRIALAPIGGPQPAKATQPQRATPPATSPLMAGTFPTALNTFGSPFPLNAGSANQEFNSTPFGVTPPYQFGLF